MKKLLLMFVGILCSLVSMAAVNTSLIDGITLPSVPTTTYTLGDVVWSGSGSNAIYLVKCDDNGNGIMQAAAAFYGTTSATRTWANAADGTNDGSSSTSGVTWDASGIFLGSAGYTTSGQDTYVNFARRGNLRTTRTFAYRFTGCTGISALVKSNGTNASGAACLAVYELGSDNSQTEAGTASSMAKALDIVTVEGLSASKTYVAYIYGANASNGELYEIAFLSAPTPKHSVTYNLNGGTGTIPTQSDVKEGATFTLASAEGLTGPAGLALKGWNDGTKTYAPGSTYTMNKSNVVLTAIWEQQVTLIEAVLNGGTNEPTVSGEYAGSAVAKTQSSPDATVGGYKFDSGCYVGLTLDGTTFKKGDVLHVNITKKNSGGSKLALYADLGETLICVTNIYQETGDVTFELTEDFDGLTTFYLYRSAEYAWNAYVASAYVVRGVEATAVSLGNIGYATFYDSEHAVKVPAGVTPYVFGMNLDYELDLVKYSDALMWDYGMSFDNVIPAGVAVVLQGANDAVLEYVAAEEDEYPVLNYLLGTDEAAPTVANFGGACYFYALTLNANSDPGSVGLYWMNENGAAFTNKAHKAYLALPTSMAGAGMYAKKAYLFNKDATAIKNVDSSANSAKAQMFNIAGQRVNGSAKGIIIKNGKKMLVK